MDFVKGVAIILVMWGHVEVTGGVVSNWVNTWHVPVFLILSGYLFEKFQKDVSSFEYTKKKILKPYVIFNLFAIITNSVVIFLQCGSLIESAKIGVINLYKTIVFYGIHALWFLASYMLATFIFLKIKDKGYSRLILYSGIFVGVIFSILWQEIKVIYASIILTSIEILVVSILRSIVCATFIMIGADLFKVLQKVERKFIIIGFGMISLIASIICSIYAGIGNFSTLLYGQHSIAYIVASITGAMGFILVAYGLQVSSKLLCWFGKNSMILLITHSTFQITLLSQYISKIFTSNEIAIGLLSTLIMIVLEVPIIHLFNGRLKLLIVPKT